ncbi:EAL domain-containing protein [Fredinandcohnia sp. QZ13]|uniref:putative bifunctional diguanylate cyclase/phosphodiesterase n=1 Tax=Fredinandcohnia sp. QZ13 TaxID=3073144 RepID=UPI0028680470|nr:EAL domain-containing protein [Fredinandcohnia sp. QZ13]
MISTFILKYTNSLITFQHIRGMSLVIPDDGFFSSSIFLPFLLLSMFLCTFVAILGNRYQRKLNRQERYFRPLYDLNPSSIIMIDPNGFIIDINPSSEKLAGMEKRDIIGLHFTHFLPEHELEVTKQRFERVLTGEVVEYEVQIHNSKGDLIDVFVRNIPIIVENKIHGIYGIMMNITKEKRNLEKIHFMAYHTPLTNLPNKRKLSEDVAKNIANVVPFSLIYLDLNEFKKTNDRYGHLAGDAVLTEVAKRLREVDNQGVAYHIGGDEFAVTLPLVQHDAIEKIAWAIADEICLPITYQEFTLEVFASIGIARFPFDAKTIEELLQKADLAMYASKEHGRGQLIFYHDTLLKKVEERFKLEQDLKEALEKREFEVYFQPQFEIQTGKFRGAEALLRWNHPEKGVLGPDVFIHVLEDTGLVVDVGEWVITEVLGLIYSWTEAGYEFEHISVNLSPKHFEKHSLCHFIEEVNKEHTTCLHRLDIEITESALINLERSIDSVRELKKLGISISLDDFGTGYSSLSVLHQLPIDCLKIDRSFIRNFNSDSKALIQMIIQMADNLNVKVVAEGIETKEQLAFLINQGCTYGQGYYFSRPLPKTEFEEKWLKGP